MYRNSDKVNISNVAIMLWVTVTFTLYSCSGSGNNTADTAETDTAQTDTLKVIKENGPVHFSTSDEALKFMRNSGHWDKYSHGIIVRMASENLPYAEKLLNSKYPRFIVVDKGSMRVLLYDKYGCKLKQYRMACARNYGTKHAKGDSRTVEGFFSAEGIYDSTKWLYVSDSGVVSRIPGQFGPRFIRLKTPITRAIGIHGTCAPWSIGRRCSHGCIRLSNEDILDLVKYAEKGMPIIVNPGPRDIAVNKHEGHHVSWITVDNDPIDLDNLPEIKNVSAKHDSTQQVVDSVSEESIEAVPVQPSGHEEPQTVPDSI